MKTTSIKDMTPEQREKLREELRKEEAADLKRKEAARRGYVKLRDQRVRKLCVKAQAQTQQLQEFKSQAAEFMEELHAELSNYGEIKKSSKGGFQVITSDGKFKAVRTRDTDPKWDERSIKGIAILRDFLENKVTGDPKILEMFMDFLARNEAGDLEYSKVMMFLQYQDKFPDEEWKEGLRLLREGYSVDFKKFAFEFYMRNDEGRWVRIPLNFSQL
jgi:hypothetical protein